MLTDGLDDERETGTERQRDRERETHTERQGRSDRNMGRDQDRDRDREVQGGERERDAHVRMQTGRQTERQAETCRGRGSVPDVSYLSPMDKAIAISLPPQGSQKEGAWPTGGGGGGDEADRGGGLSSGGSGGGGGTSVGAKSVSGELGWAVAPLSPQLESRYS